MFKRTPGETLASVLDDAAALGNDMKLLRLSKTWGRRARACMKSSQVSFEAWSFASSAAHWRAFAIGARLLGNIRAALAAEDESEQQLAAFRAARTKGDLS